MTYSLLAINIIGLTCCAVIGSLILLRILKPILKQKVLSHIGRHSLAYGLLAVAVFATVGIDRQEGYAVTLDMNAVAPSENTTWGYNIQAMGEEGIYTSHALRDKSRTFKDVGVQAFTITALDSRTNDIQDNYNFAYLQSESDHIEEFARAAYTKKHPFNLLVSLDIQ